MLKLARLSIAASITALACICFFYVTDPQSLYVIYRCARGAESPLDCYLGKPTAFKTTTFGVVYEGNTEDMMDFRVLAYGAYEKPELFFLRDVSRGGVFLDIGANKGLYSLFMSKYEREVHAFEPYEPVLKKFRSMVASSGTRNITIHPVGLGEKREILTFEEPTAANMGTGSFAFVSTSGAHRQLEITRGDDALHDAGVSDVELIKMDIEGFEKPALRGLAKALARSRPIVAFEVTVDPARPVLFKSMEEISKTFPAGYEFLAFRNWDMYTGFYELGPVDGVVRFDRPSGQFPFNIVAFPVEKKNRVPLKGPVKRGM